MRISQLTGEEIKLEDLHLIPDVDGVIRFGSPSYDNGWLLVPIHPERPGDGSFTVLHANGETVGMHVLAVSRTLTIYDRVNGGFTGDTMVLIAMSVYCLIVGAVMMYTFVRTKGPDLYAQLTIYFAGFSLFAFCTGFSILRVMVLHLRDPFNYSMLSVISAITDAGERYMRMTLPLVVAFAVAMAVSNIALLLHERLRVQNALGIVAAVLLLAGEAVALWLIREDFSGSDTEYHIRQTVLHVYTTVFVYFECMLAGSVIAGIRSARYNPLPVKDFIIILGCHFRKDGSLPPLLRGRADRAVAFWKDQKAKTGAEAWIIPSGGQGEDETMPEAEAISRYLVSQGIPDRLILKEDRSRSTEENMAFSKEIIQAVRPEGSVIFSTTNYHVFRSGILAAQAGLRAEGIGSKTKWWFWPNAFLRRPSGPKMETGTAVPRSAHSVFQRHDMDS